MKLGIDREVLETKKDLTGRVLYQNVAYRVYDSFFFGLFRIYIRISPTKYVKGCEDEYVVTYCAKQEASSFSREEAEMLVRDMMNNPNKFVMFKN